MKNQSGYTTVELLIALVGLLALCLGVAAVYVLFHFLGKFW